MNLRFRLRPFLTLGMVLLSYAMFGHDVPVHQAITVNAVESAIHASAGLIAFVSQHQLPAASHRLPAVVQVRRRV